MKHTAKFLLAALLLLGLVSAFDQPAGTKLWDFYVGQPIQSSPALGADGTVFFGADNGKLYAFDPQGSGKWEFSTGDALVASPAVAADGSIIIGSLDGNLYAVGADGVEKWRFRSNGKIVSSPALGASNSVFFGTMAKTLYAVNGEGAKRWELPLDDAVVSSPAVARDGTIYVASLSGVLYAVDFWGKVKWQFKASDRVNSSPAIGPDGTIYFGAFDGHFYALKPNGQKKWTFATGAAVRGSAAVGPDGVVYVGSDDRKLYAFAPDGFKLWSYTTGGWVRSTPAVGRDGTLYVGSYDNSLHAITQAGLKAWEFATDSAISSSAALSSNGVLYFGGWNKRFYAVRGGEGLAPDSWAKFRGDARQTAAQLEFAPMQLAQPAVRPAFPVEDTQPSVGPSKAAIAEELARAQAARTQALTAKKDATARTKAAAVPPVAPKPVDTSAEAKRLAKEEAEANRKMLADNDRVLKAAALARTAQEQDDRRRALSASELAHLAKRDAVARDAAARKAAEAAELQAKAQTEADRKAAMETARQTKLQQDAERKADEAKAKADAQAAQEAQQRALKEAEQARQLQQADEARRAASAAELARTAKKEADQRTTAKQAADLAETKRLQTEAAAAQAAQRKAEEAAALQAKTQAETERKAAMETARQVKIQQDTERKAAEAKTKADAQVEIETSKRVLEGSRLLLKEAEAGRKLQEADEARRAQAAAELARLAKKDSEQRAAARQATELAEAKRLQAEAEAAALQAKAQAEAERRAAMETARLTKQQHAAEQAEAARQLAAAKAQAEAEANATAEAERHRAKEQEIARKVMADSERAALTEQERQTREAARQAALEQAAERKRLEAERQKWEPVSGGFFRSLFGGGAREPKANVETPAPSAVPEPVAVPPQVAEATQRQAAEAAAAQAKAQAEAERRAATESAREAKLQQETERKAQAAERRSAEAERQKWEPEQGGFFRRLFGFGSSEPKVKAEAPAVPVVAAPVVYAPPATALVAPPAPVVSVPVAPPPPVAVPVVAAPSVPMKFISDSAEVVRPAAPAPSFFTPAQPTVDPLAAQIELLKQRAAAAQAQVEPQFVQPAAVPPAVVHQVAPPVASIEQSAPSAQPEQPGFWSRVGSFFIRSKKDQQARAPQPPTAPQPPQQRPAAPRPPANVAALDPQVPAQVPAGLAPGGMTATNFPRVQYEAVTNQNNLFLPRAQVAQPVVPGMPQPPAPPREVREMRPGKTGSQGLAADLPGSTAPIEIIQGRIKTVLRVYATGAGRVAPDLNGAELEIGQTYMLEAQPVRGALFLGWTGSYQTNSPVLRFVMRTGTTLTANFQFAHNLDRELPEVAITAPDDGTRLASPTFVLQGAARDNVAVARVDVSVNDGPWQPAQGTAESWGFQGVARPGPNAVRVRAVDQAGNESPTLLRTLHYTAASILTVRVNGAGTVTPDGHGRLLDLGTAYEVRANPAAGQVFTGWSGGVRGTSPTLQFTMQPNLVIEANFAPRPVVSLARGVFNGLVYPTSSLVPTKCGFFQIEVAADGAFTGFLRQGNATQPLSGRFDANGQASATVQRAGRSAVTLSLQMETTAGERLMGRFDDDGTTVDLFAYRQVFDGVTSVTPLAGRYTFVMPGPTNTVNSPAGDGFGEIVVDGAGRVKFGGDLPDGTPVRAEAFMARNGLWPLHVPLAGGRGMLLGWITVSKDPSLDAFGEVIWHKPLTPQDRYYPAGFSTRRHLFGNLYTPMAKASSGDRTIGGMLSGGNLDKVVLGNSGSPLNLTVQQFTWNFRPDSGFVGGSFIHPTTKEETTFRGALLQKRGWTSGYFLGQNQSGVVHLQLPQ
ncbi:MAG: Serine/threonine-protein kinase AfsK [Verrucomicrobiota bacterium]|jgi:outer membrane protein assembly factor BamB